MFLSPLYQGHLFLVLVLDGVIDLHIANLLQLLHHQYLVHRLRLIVMLNGLPWNPTEVILSFLRLYPSTAFQTRVDYEGYSISSKRFLPTVVDIMVI